MNSVAPVKSSVARANAARNEAMKRLIANHQDEYNEILTEERHKRDLFGLPGQKPPSMKQKLEEKDKEIEELKRVIEQYGIK